ncbi:DASS family sodium-coupled anion symporter [Campylobacter jejuni]|uniref:2-oxoglutarate translocator n=1 Tax=Campylobacter jejuni TaxID=197 RepID=A0AB36G535_CAMJU|nr:MULTISPECIES: DASS family sodium-coupled anion symporter [Campylobacter]EAI4691523.1 DASS family sodium-coupled anion symporter [Campylobacter jejuni]ECP9363740.1 DASS family sodium-coupled anion symporter [Campylobacter jejuni]EIY3538202.1 DASS family sodium-coupled anion symporter [Campylobacter jejuni]MEA8950795.1 DASS family sodium-coupled anion symporter [Campylobacter jejuni]MEA8964577.1 DASS family sodium-coupled anion symporter [Campylobacter jejuni]
MDRKKIPLLVLCILIAAVFWLIPTPVGLEDNSWHFLGLFIAVIMAVILQVMPLGAVCMIAIAIVALSGITTTQSSVRATHIKTLEGIVLRDNSNIYKTTMDEAVEAATLQALINANISRNLKAKVDEILKSSTDVNYQIENLSKIYTKATSKTSTQQLIDETKISALNTLALDFLSQKSIDEKVNTAISNLKSKTGIKDALSGFSNSLIWLIVISIIVARGVIKTGLGERLAYHFISIFGKKTLGIAYSIAFCETILAPVTPSNTARAGAIINPIVQAIARSFKSTPEDGTQNKIGTYLSLVNYQANPISSAMFITATAPNPLVVDLIAQATNLEVHLTWGQWALGMFLPGIAAMLLMPLVLYFLSPPEIKSTPNASAFAKDKLKELGKMKNSEKIMLSVFVLLLLLWAGALGLFFGISLDATSVALLGLSLVLISGVLTFGEVLAEKAAWNTLVWFSALVMMATLLGKLGVTQFLAEALGEFASAMGLGEISIMIFLSLAFLYTHYFFASTTAHISAMFFVFYSAGLALGAPPLLYAFIMIASGNVMMALTHYATGTAPVIFGTGYVTLKKWWSIGFVISIVDIVVMIAVGLIWWKILGFY